MPARRTSGIVGVVSGTAITQHAEDLAPYQVDVSADGRTLWVHVLDGSTVGRFSKTFGMDVHTTITEQLAGSGQCLHCTHAKPGISEWLLFCDLMRDHYSIQVDRGLMQFP